MRVYVYTFYKSNQFNEENGNLFSAMSDTSRIFYTVLLCLFCMSDDVNRDVNETLPNNIGTIIHEFHQEDRKIIRSLENLTKKQTNARYAVIFTETCIHENLLPKFTNIYIYSHRHWYAFLTHWLNNNII